MPANRQGIGRIGADPFANPTPTSQASQPEVQGPLNCIPKPPRGRKDSTCKPSIFLSLFANSNFHNVKLQPYHLIFNPQSDKPHHQMIPHRRAGFLDRMLKL